MRFTRILLLVSLLALVVTPVALALRFTDDDFSLPNGETGKPYSVTLHGAGGCGPALPYQYRILDGTVPDGLKFSSDGTIAGTPTAAGSWNFWVELSDQNPPSASWCRPETAQRLLTIKIIQGLLINQRQSTLTPGILNQAYSLQLTAAGGGTQTWSISSGALPAGMTLNASTGMLSGTPTQTGDYHFQVKVADGTRSDVQTYAMSVVEPLAIAAGSASAPAQIEVGRAYSATLTATGGRSPYTWSATNLPTWLTLDPATGAISGQPTVPGTVTAEITVTDALGLKTTQNLTVAVAAKLAFVNKPLPRGKVGRSYHGRLATVGGVAPRAFRLLRGKLPAGLRLNTLTGALSGTPRKAGTYRFTVRVRDKLNFISTKPYVLKVS
jgi:putative Ig domain-containing protein